MKNVRNTILAGALFAVVNLFAQESPDVQFKTMTNDTPLEEMSNEYLLAHRVHLRETPSLKSKRIGVLNIGTKLALYEKSENSVEIDGVESNFYKVRVGNAEGWVWGGLIAQQTLGSEANYDVKFVYGFESNKINEEGKMESKHQIRAYKNGRQIDKIVFDAPTSAPLEIKNIGNKGLFNVEDILTFQVANAETGDAIGDSYIFWNNGKFTNVASLIDYSDATYTKTESFVFPSDMEGLKSTIVLETIITDKAREIEGKLGVDKKRMVVSFYAWDGHTFSEKETVPPISTDLAIN